MRLLLFVSTAAVLAIIAMASDILIATNVASVAVIDQSRTDAYGFEISEFGVDSAIDPVPLSGTVAVGGIRVNTLIADNVARLLNDARADGIVLGGWGWRSHTRQHQLRLVNGCPDGWNHSADERSSDFAPSYTCRVPTARPGSSLHERGLAVDFTCNGRPMAGSRCFAWLSANAARFGLHNLASEPWHWSTTGR